MNTLPTIEVEELEVEHIVIRAPRQTLAQTIRAAIEDYKRARNLADRAQAARVAVCNPHEE